MEKVEVNSISPTTGADFSVLPAENASGNWVKVTQRVTVKIRMDMKPGDPPLRAGMSTYVSIEHRPSPLVPAALQLIPNQLSVFFPLSSPALCGRSNYLSKQKMGRPDKPGDDEKK